MKKTDKFFITIVIIMIFLSFLFLINNKEKSVLLFLSDYQNPEYNENQKQDNLKTILKKIKKDYKSIDNLSFLGDYQEWPLVDEKSNLGVIEARMIVNDVYKNVNPMFIAGNHDYIDKINKPEYYTQSGLYEYSNYYLYLINFNDYFDIKKTVNKLEKTLKGISRKKPVIILSHMPLHDGVRGDNSNSFYLFDVINECAINSDIIYLFGHNHSLGYDNDIGGSIVYKAKGESIKIKYSNGNIEDEKINFTYMNAGYVGYYNDDETNLNLSYNSKYDTTETISVFEVYNNKINIYRYSKDGIYKKYVIMLKN